jgi:hypothetical protein
VGMAFSLGGLHTHLDLPDGRTFPVLLDRVFVYFQLWGDPGEYRLRVRLVRIQMTADGEEEAQLGADGEPREFPIPTARPVAVPGLNYVEEFAYPIGPVPFREAGLYEYQLWADGTDEPIAASAFWPGSGNMTNEPQVSEDGPYRVFRWLGSPVRRVNSTLLLGPPVRGNATAEELTWPVVSPVRRVNSTFLDGPPVRGNATAEELAWPVVETGSEAIPSLPGEPLPPEAESGVRHLANELVALLERTAPADRPLVLRRLLALVSAA